MLFSPGEADDITYRNIRDSSDPRVVTIRDRCEALWREYESFADNHYLVEVRRDFHPRYWEMYLSVTLLRLGYSIPCPKPGPDVGIEVEGQRLWIEAVAPKSGDEASPDRVPEMQFGKMNWVPNEQMILRYLSSIRSKLTGQYPRWIDTGIVSRRDAFVIAVNPKLLPHEIMDTMPPRILQAAFPIGSPSVSIDSRTGTKLSEGYQYRMSITKAQGAQVPTGVFLQADGVALSGLLCSRVDVANQPNKMGEDFQFVTNPLASVQLPSSFRLPGTYFPTVRDGDELKVTVR